MKKFKSKLIGKRAYIKDSVNSWASGEYGTIKYFDGDHYHIAIWEGDQQLIFDRNEFIVRKDQSDPAKRYQLRLTTDNLTEDEKHNFLDLTDDEQKEVTDPTVALHIKIDILTTADDFGYYCCLCNESRPHEELKKHIKIHLSRMGALKFHEYVGKKVRAQRPKRHGCRE